MFKVRVAKPGDCGQMLDIYAPVIEESATSFEYQVPSPDVFWERVRKTLIKYPWLVCCHHQRLIGYAYAGSHRSRKAYQWSVELSVYIDSEYHRMGIARILYQNLLAVLELQGFYTALAGISLPNPNSVKFHEALGFTAIGVYQNIGFKFDQWHSTGWWERPIQSYAAEVKDPVPFSELLDSTEFLQIIEATNNELAEKIKAD
jgi:phosphinothricin acetyltransferase